MTISKYVQILVFTFVPTCLVGMEKPEREMGSLDWVEFTAENLSTAEAFFEKIKPVYISAFAGPDEAQMKEEQPEKYQEMVKKGETIKKKLEREMTSNGTIEKIKLGFSLGLDKVPVAIIKTAKGDILGFCIFFPLPEKLILSTMLKIGKIKGIEWVNGKENKEEKESVNSSESTLNNEVYVDLVAVKQDCKGCGYGKKLLFSILSHLPNLKKIYLTTHESKSNKDTQGFYEYCKFVHTATCTNEDNTKCRLYEFYNK